MNNWFAEDIKNEIVILKIKFLIGQGGFYVFIIYDDISGAIKETDTEAVKDVVRQLMKDKLQDL